MREDLVQHPTHLEQSFRCLVAQDSSSHLVQIDLPIRSWDPNVVLALGRREVERGGDDGQGLEREERATEVSPRGGGEGGGYIGGQGETLEFRDVRKDLDDLDYVSLHQTVGRRTSSSDGAPTRSRRHLERMGPMILEVELAQRMIRRLAVYFSIVRRRADWASRESRSASLMMTTGRDVSWCRVERERTLESLLRVEVDLLSLRNLLEDVGDDSSIVHASVAAAVSTGRGEQDERGREFNMIIRLDDVEIDLALRGRHEHALLDTNLRRPSARALVLDPTRRVDAPSPRPGQRAP